MLQVDGKAFWEVEGVPIGVKRFVDPGAEHIRYEHTAEAVRAAHPDKFCDRIADSIVDAHISADTNSRVAVEVTATSGHIHIMGEVTSAVQIDHGAIVENVIEDIGYTDTDIGGSPVVTINVHAQSPDIGQAVDKEGAGDQGIVIGYATKETVDYMPMPFVLATKLVRALDESPLPFLRPDGKAQITMKYDGACKPLEITHVVVSTQHSPDVCRHCLREAIMEEIIKPTLPACYLTQDTQYHINPSGRFTLGGPAADTGLTGRKLMVDSYGPAVRHGAGSYSGKDSTKIDRSGAYMARYIAKNIVAAQIASRCEVELAYAIGMTEPLAVTVNTFDTAGVSDDIIAEAVREVFDLSPAGIISTLDLRRPIYAHLAAYGHFGRSDLNLPWEQLDKGYQLLGALSRRLTK